MVSAANAPVQDAPAGDETGAGGTPSTPYRWSREVNSFLWFLGLVVLIWLIGFMAAIPLYLFFFLKVRSKEGWMLSILYCVLTRGVIYVLFSLILHIPLYQGVFKT